MVIRSPALHAVNSAVSSRVEFSYVALYKRNIVCILHSNVIVPDDFDVIYTQLVLQRRYSLCFCFGRGCEHVRAFGEFSELASIKTKACGLSVAEQCTSLIPSNAMRSHRHSHAHTRTQKRHHHIVSVVRSALRRTVLYSI